MSEPTSTAGAPAGSPDARRSPRQGASEPTSRADATAHSPDARRSPRQGASGPTSTARRDAGARSSPRQGASEPTSRADATAQRDAGDLDTLYRRHHARLRGLAAAVMLDRSMADEIVHDAFAGLAERIEHVDNPVGYLQRSVINLALRAVKLRGRRLPARPIEPPMIPDIDELWMIVSTLPATQRAVLVLRFWEDLSQEQIADVLAIPLGTVKSTLHRALRAVKAELDATPDSQQRSER